MKNLKSLIDDYCSVNTSRIIFDGFLNESDNISLTYQELFATIKELNAEYFFSYSNKLFVLCSKNWNRNFYEILFSVIYSQNAFLIFDFNWPDDYINFIISNTKPNFIIYDYDDQDRFKSYNQVSTILNNNFRFISLEESKQKVNLIDLAYVICTSGTTGIPKVIEVLNSSIIPNIIELSNYFNLDEIDVIYQASSLTFDPSLIEIFTAMNSNSSLLILPQLIKLLPDNLNTYLEKHKVNFLQLTPTLYRNISHSLLNLNLKTLILGGELFPQKCKTIETLIKNGVNIFNIYGITELSCWSSIHQVKLEDLNNLKGVPIGKCLAETEFYVKDQNNEFTNINKSNEKCFHSSLFHSSKTRTCFINGQKEDFIDSGDLIELNNKDIYIIGRNNRSIKINGKLTDLYLLENKCRSLNWIDDCCAVFKDENQVVLFVFLKEHNENNESILRKYITSILPSNYEPFKIIFVKNTNISVNNHGKIDVKKLMSICLNQNEILDEISEASLAKIFESSWRNTLGTDPIDSKTFIEMGGNSLRALIFIDHLEGFLKKFNHKIKINRILDALFRYKFSDLISFVSTEIYQNDSNEIEIPTKKLKSTKEPICIETNNKVIGWISRFDRQNVPKSPNNESKLSDISVKWKYNTSKCIDATPLVIINSDMSQSILVGSHSSKFVCVNNEGDLKWEFNASGRIESSATVSKCKNFIIFGSYDHSLYVLRIENGELEWKYDTDDIVKSSPCVDPVTGLVYFGSHDKHIYCLNIEKKELVWRNVLDSSSIFSSPVLTNDQQLIVATLGGNLFSLSSQTGEVHWKFEFQKPVFASPIIDRESNCIFIGTCGGYFYCIRNNSKKWEFQVKEPIFSNACLVNDLVIFGCHDNHLYCLKKFTGELEWRLDCQSQVYSTCSVYLSYYIVNVASDGLLFILDLQGNVIIKKDLFSMKNSCYSSPILYKNYIYIGCRDNHLYSIEIN